MTETPKCSYKRCQREAWRPTDGEKLFCIFHSPKIEEKRDDFYPLWIFFLAEHQNGKDHIHDLFCKGFVFPDGICFRGATFSGVTNFCVATFSGDADFEYATFFGVADFEGATFSGYADFEGATFSMDARFVIVTFSEYADFKGSSFLGGAFFRYTKFNEGIFKGADFTHADLSYGSFINCSFPDVKYNLYSRKPSKWYKLWEILKPVPITNFTGIETNGILAASNRKFVRDIEDQQFITQFKKQHKIWYYIWLYTCDCGRSFLLFLFWCLFTAFIFGLIYSCKVEVWFKNSDSWSWITPYYYSLFTFSTFGFGDVAPRLTCGLAQLTVTGEVFLGYLGLGGLISIFANKLARRA